MPVISRFYGIVIAIYYKEHAPPHFHAKYGGQVGVVTIADLQLTEGRLPKRVTTLVLDWALEHRNELMDNWELARAGRSLQEIEPLT
ncbi:MAG: DUF4160 domain-containing protein [Chloroflexi bacterium]|nr:DUF4160 domain-containing protein [Chloroflexota bacterium]MBI3733371.1 DUF4160 domain-containing protein [Chloroflexota bacterium]